MALFSLFGIFFLLKFDAERLYERNEDLYEETLRMTPMLWAVLGVFFYALTGPIYLYRRFHFMKRLRAEQLLNSQQKQTHLPLEDLLSDASGLFIGWLTGLVFFILIFNFIATYWPSFRSEFSDMVLTAIFSTLLMLILIFRTTRYYPHQGFLGSVGVRKFGVGALRLFIVPLLTGVIFASFAALMIFTREVSPDTPLSMALEGNQSSALLMVFMFMALLTAPLVEEVIFRGYFFHVIDRAKGINWAVLIIGATFGLLHIGQYWGDWQAIVVISLFGFILTILRAWSGSTISSIVAHYAYNGVVTFVPLFMLVASNPAYFQYTARFSQLTYEQKEELLVEGLNNEPKRAEIYNDLAWLYAEEGKKLEEALALAEKALSFAPKQASFLDTKAEVLFKMGRIQEAIAIEKGVVERFPDAEIFKKQLEKFRERNN